MAKTKKRAKKVQLIEIARSFSFKLNAGNYESRDFFCSQKAECKPSEAEKVSEALYQFCKNEVIKSVNDFKREEKQPSVKVELPRGTTSFKQPLTQDMIDNQHQNRKQNGIVESIKGPWETNQ